jgi:hypothetical protein
MSATKEKGRPAEGSPIPKVVLTDATEFTTSLLNFQASRLVRLYAVNAAMAETLAPLIFLEVLR